MELRPNNPLGSSSKNSEEGDLKCNGTKEQPITEDKREVCITAVCSHVNKTKICTFAFGVHCMLIMSFNLYLFSL